MENLQRLGYVEMNLQPDCVWVKAERYILLQPRRVERTSAQNEQPGVSKKKKAGLKLLAVCHFVTFPT